MKVVDLPLSKIKRYPNNPRKNQAAVAHVKKSLKEFGFRQPLVVDKDYVIVVGDTRYLGALELGMKVAPVHVATDLTPEQIAAYRLVDNKVGEISEWDEERLFQEVLALSGGGYDIENFGFSAAELAMDSKDYKTKPDTRYLEDFDVSPVPKPKWILISAPENECATILNAIKQLKSTPHAKVEYSGEK